MPSLPRVPSGAEGALPFGGVPELQDPHPTGGSDDHCPGYRSKQQRHTQRQGEIPPEKLERDAVEILQDEHQQHQQDQDADQQGGPERTGTCAPDAFIPREVGMQLPGGVGIR